MEFIMIVQVNHMKLIFMEIVGLHTKLQDNREYFASLILWNAREDTQAEVLNGKKE